ncbi:hypothetical protein L228DRAFT_106016 [Xylona heveae TC161]|uniref:DNA-directed RNA polymerase III subunit Rpc5 n=1 Tax=Xylona heveae (strain CBS 132557 / TC161) TaxID=1328760 RepID=A0A165H9U9_XYLHT|nr:hypothetical protein L228DRAFT_106016 [Xylona heveae TC161]KZF23189.1 hypothetical protein L228DRAFT_106016 [Xylona heveae TC161]
MNQIEDEDDPVLREYDVYIPQQTEEKLYVLQYPNRSGEAPYSEANHARPLELRLKPHVGLVELDVPLNVYDNYDKTKGIRWGEAVRKGGMDRGGSYGFAGGFSGGAVPQPARKGSKNSGLEDEINAAELQDALLADFEGAVRKGHVLSKQTLGGQIVPPKDGDPIYMIGVFRGDQLHLSKVTQIVQMRPQFHHIDAMVDNERNSARSLRESAAPRQTEVRAVQMTVKAADGDDMDMGETAKVLRAAQEENWQRLIYHDEDSQESWDKYHENLFLEDLENAPKLETDMTNDEYLDSISAPRVDPTDPDRKPQYSKLEPDSEEEADDAIQEAS